MFQSLSGLDSQLINCACNNELIKNTESFITNKYGEQIPVLLSASGVFDAKGKAIGIVEILRDIRSYKNLLSSLDVSIRESTDRISAVSQQLSASSQDVAQLASHLKEQSENVSYESKNAVNSASDVKDKTRNCNEVASIVNKNMGLIDSSMNESVKKIEELKDKSQIIISVVNTIQDIATQTNLLALNASIEAARAGNAGKSFAIVAGEIKKLAQNTGVSANEINESVSGILREIDETVTIISKTRQDLADGSSNIDTLYNLINEIDKASEYMFKITREIAVTSDKSTSMSKEQLSSMTEVASASDHLSQVAQKLSYTVDDVLNKMQRQI
jgi:methyl-accepting chemotaxis protein